MANSYALNFAIPGATNIDQLIWKLTRTMKAAGWTYKASSNGTTKETTGVAASDLWGGNVNPLLDSYPTLDSVVAWWVGQGPQTLKIPITAAPTGTPLRGETITQATSLAEGELVGYVFDSISVSGWLVVLPHTGTFDNTHLITGSSSSATITPNGTIITYVREFMFSKVSANQTDGAIFYVCADASGESASLFSTLAASAGCTALIWPGAGGTGNTFPAIAISMRGTGGVTTGTGKLIGDNSTFGISSNSQIATVNAIPSTGVSADGSFFVAATSSASNVMSGIMYTRLDDSDPGDVDPYIFCTANNTSYASFSRTTNIGGSNTNTFTVNNIFGAATPYFTGYQARGVSTGSRDVTCTYGAGVGGNTIANTFMQTSPGSIGAWRTLNSPATTPPILREPLTVFTPGSVTSSTRHIKGRCRWLAAISTGNTYDTVDSKSWLVLNVSGTGTLTLIIGPYDGSTTPQP